MTDRAASGRLAVVAAGGTGGHLFPAEALARVLAERGWRIVLATDARGANYAQHFPAEERLALEAATFRAGDPVGMVKGVIRIIAGVLQAKKAFGRLKPSVVIGFGGYPSLPALIAAGMTGAPRMIHEQNAVLGRVNRFMAPKMDAVACAFPTLEKAAPAVKAKAVVVGNPVRAEIRALHEHDYKRPDGTVHLLVTGGSQGARLLSEMVPDAVAMMAEDLRLRLRVEQQTRMESIEFARHTYAEAGVEAEIAPFFRNMAAKLDQAHLVVGRAGASTVCELAVAGRPSLLAPLRIAADDHQTYNARLLTEVGAAEVIREDEMSAEALSNVLSRLLSDSDKLAAMAQAAKSVAQPQAAERLADLVEQTAR